jgi:hypothetical protein
MTCLCFVQRRLNLDNAFVQTPQELNDEIALLRELHDVEAKLKKAREHAVRRSAAAAAVPASIRFTATVSACMCVYVCSLRLCACSACPMPCFRW